ncbi:hypothetical protein LIT25_07945 [Bacillus sp. F19]|nr:hypothetical protein LIT25_07945 [Bacillus sp. F19]
MHLRKMLPNLQSAESFFYHKMPRKKALAPPSPNTMTATLAIQPIYILTAFY